MEVRLCSRYYSELRIGSEPRDLIDDLAGRVVGLGRVAYSRVSVRALDRCLDILRCIARPEDAAAYLRSRAGRPHVAGLLRRVAELGVTDAYLVLSSCTLEEELATDPYVGDLYLAYRITPISRMLTYTRLKRQHSLVFDEARFNVCTLTEGFTRVGCVLVGDEPLDGSVVDAVVGSLLDAVSALGLRPRYVTWLLGPGYLKVVDY